jgi:hypothetical protein
VTHARWKKREGSDIELLDIELLVRKLNDARQKDPASGEVTFTAGRWFEDATLAVESGTEFLSDIPQADQRVIVNKAMVEAPDPLTPSSLIGEINRRAEAFLRKPPRPYVLVTSISARYFAELSRSEVSGRRMYFRQDLPPHLRASHKQARDRSTRKLLGPLPKSELPSQRYTAVWIHTRGRSHWEAVIRALDALDLLRGIWNFALRKWSRTTGGARRPVNQLLLGPVHSLHDPDGSLAPMLDWHESAEYIESEYIKPVYSSRELSQRWTEVKKREEDIRQWLARSAYAARLEDALRRYTRALDSFDWGASFLRLWGLLETLTGTQPHESHDLTVKRATFLYEDQEREFHVQVLNHLRHYRNRSVHGGESSETIEAYLYQLKRYVEELLLFHLDPPNYCRFKTIAQAAAFLDLPPDPADLRRKVGELHRESKSARAAAELHKRGERYRSGPPM